MFTPKPFRAKASEYGELAKTSTDPDEKQALLDSKRSFTDLADNEQWLGDNFKNTVHSSDRALAKGVTLAAEEEHILRCMGAAVILQWSTLPAKLQRELYDAAGSMGEVVKTPALRGQIARFLSRHSVSNPPQG
jgi:hypothetical protein